MNSPTDPQPQPERDSQLESLLEQRLKSLPLIPAPRALAPNVLARLEARFEREWWRRAWWHWPIAAQAAFLLVTLLLIAGASTGSWLVSDGLARGAGWLGDRLAELAVWGRPLALLADTGLTLTERFGPTLLLYGGILSLFAYAACLGAGTALARIVGRHS